LSEPFELLDLHVAAFNHGVESGDWNPLVEGYVPDGELVFVGRPHGPFQGRFAIAEAYEADPPDDQIRVVEASVVGGEIVAAYGWSKDEGAKAGLMILTPYKLKLQRVVVTVDPS
jgi:steroid Delta-isomerase